MSGRNNIEIVKAFLDGKAAEPPTGLRTDGHRIYSCGSLLATRRANGIELIDKKRLPNRHAARQHYELVRQIAEVAGIEVAE